MKLDEQLKAAVEAGDSEEAYRLAALLLERRKQENGEPSGSLKLTGTEVFAVDLDDTVGSFADDFRRAYAEREGLTVEEAFRRFPVQPGSIIENWYGGDAAANWEDYLDLERRGLLYSRQPVRPGAGETLNWLHRETGGRVVFLTARPKAYGAVSRRWLKEVVGLDFAPTVRHSHNKHLVKGYDILIDDSVQQVEKVASTTRYRKGRQVVFMEQPHTRSKVNLPVARARNWSDVRSLIQAAI